MGKTDNKPNFRSAAKRASFEHIEKLIRDAHKKLSDNKFKIAQLSKENGQLKSDLAALHQLKEEFKK